MQLIVSALIKGIILWIELNQINANIKFSSIIHSTTTKAFHSSSSFLYVISYTFFLSLSPSLCWNLQLSIKLPRLPHTSIIHLLHFSCTCPWRTFSWFILYDYGNELSKERQKLEIAKFQIFFLEKKYCKMKYNVILTDKLY